MTKAAGSSALALAGIEALGLDREQAASFVGLSARKFDELVADGRMPRPKRIDGRLIWSRVKLIAAFEALPDDEANKRTETLDDWHTRV